MTHPVLFTIHFSVNTNIYSCLWTTNREFISIDRTLENARFFLWKRSLFIKRLVRAH